jgi:hypothetical protein
MQVGELDAGVARVLAPASNEVVEDGAGTARVAGPLPGAGGLQKDLRTLVGLLVGVGFEFLCQLRVGVGHGAGRTGGECWSIPAEAPGIRRTRRHDGGWAEV